MKIKKILKLFSAGYRQYAEYQKELKIFKATHGDRFLVQNKDKWPILDEKGKTTGFDNHYVYHTAWAARKLQQLSPDQHVDISSFTYFSTLVSAFVPITFYEFNPVHIKLDNLTHTHIDLNNLPFKNNSINSLSCMHVVEHVGLGCYGDALDVDGDLQAIEELKRVVSIGGYLLFVVPIGGSAKIMFNAHRIYTYAQILSYFQNLELIEFSLIPDESTEGIIINATQEQSDSQVYGCGCFLFKKNK
ncbi:MAG: hypothetical protein Ctma_0629 [Catillopecten margaritatus gill symbiont]|uniref:DUF268 domain-containing protein n=1 Tax=Catillopecten margaritatus gill symbiont TaxID=3083288 RepID=A0AAU6PFY4_9GAMM